MSAAQPWPCAALSVAGARHARGGKPNQDAALARHDPATGGTLIAVADGHGGAPYERSAIGARLAVEAAATALLGCEKDEDLPETLVRLWRGAVEAHFHRHLPPSLAARQRTAANPRLLHMLYGTTVLAALIQGGTLRLLQLGDGEAMLVEADGMAYAPLPADPRLGGGFTSSLCLPDAARHVRVVRRALPAEEAQLLLLTTDGWRNCFSHEKDFLNALRLTRTLALAHGPEALCAQLEPWLRQASRAHSGDDCSLAITLPRARHTPGSPIHGLADLHRPQARARRALHGLLALMLLLLMTGFGFWLELR